MKFLGFHNNFNNDRPGFFEREFDDGPRGGGRMRGGPMERRGGLLGPRPNWRGPQSGGGSMDGDDDRRGSRDFPNRFDKNRRNSSRWTGNHSNDGNDGDEKNQDNSENWDQEGADSGAANDGGAGGAKMDAIEDNGPPGFENEFQQENQSQSQNQNSLASEEAPREETKHFEPPAPAADPVPEQQHASPPQEQQQQQQQEQEQHNEGSATPLCDEPENKE